MDINVNKEILKATDEYTMYIYHIVDMPFLSYVHMDTDRICFSRELSTIYFDLFNRGIIKGESTITHEINILDLMTKEQIVDSMIRMYEIINQYYQKGVRDNDPSYAFCLQDKKDLISQYYKAFTYKVFSPYEMYQYGLECYSRCEDNYAYEILFPILKGYRLSLDRIDKELKEELKLEMDKNGYVTVYRGFNKFSQLDGTSFSLSKTVAEFFAKRWKSDGYVKKYKVHISDIVAYMDYEKQVITDKAIEI